MKGCSFHLIQRVWFYIKDLGLAYSYTNDIGTKQFCRKLMSLVYLPEWAIDDAFNELERTANTDALKKLCAYYQKTWLENSVWTVRDISGFNHPIRTNNDVEGWHRRMNSKAGRGNIQFYLLIQLLKRESCLVDIMANSYLTRGAISRYQKKQNSPIAKILQSWDDHINGGRSPASIHNVCLNLVDEINFI